VVQKERDIAIADLERSLSARITHNEWVLGDYTVLGVFAIAPCEVWALQRLPDVSDMPDYLREEQIVGGPRRVTLRELKDTFPGQTMLTFRNAEVYRLNPDPVGPIPHAQVYTGLAAAQS
jgi:hypothetical protein